ncbi:MAG: phosphoribosylformylglycinamidine synthase [Siphonobacter sp.]
MIYFFSADQVTVYAVETQQSLTETDISKLNWLFGGTSLSPETTINQVFIGPRAAMITPWSTNAVEITQNMNIQGISRIEEFTKAEKDSTEYDPMISQKYEQLNQGIFTINIEPEPILELDDIAAYNHQEGLSLSDEEVDYLNNLSKKLGRKLTDAEVFGFSQVNSEHCRHKIFNGTFVIDGETKPTSLFKLIRKTSETNPNGIISAYKDNVAFVKGPRVQQLAPKRPDVPEYYEVTEFDSVISLKAETHNFPTTVEPFNGAATGTGGEIRDRLAGGQGAIPLAGTAVYMTALSRLEQDRPWEKGVAERKWLYQTPMDILIKASNGATDFGNKFGQPLITGSVLTFEHEEEGRILGYDKVIMQAGGIGYGKADQAKKHHPSQGDQIVVMGGDNYRIGLGGAAVSSADTGKFGSGIELNAIQRSNPEMQKRVANAVRGLVESNTNPIVSIHDHGAGGHLNCLSELIEETGGSIDLDKLPVGDPTLSAKEIIGNESQERMGLVISADDIEILHRIADRERAPMYVVGEVTADHRFTIASHTREAKPMDLALADMFGSAPKTIMTDETVERTYQPVTYKVSDLETYLEAVLQLEAVACKDWLTNKVDRCVGGRVAKQQNVGPLHLPLNNCGVMALDFQGKDGIATSIGHAPISALIDPAAGSRNAIAEALSNLVWAPLEEGLKSVSLSANWMWACKNKGEDARLYKAVQACSDFAINLGINIPTGKDSLSMKQKYSNTDVLAPGTVIISAAGPCNDVRAVVEPVLRKDGGAIYYINLSGDQYKLGGSSFAQILNRIGNETPDVLDAEAFKTAFNSIQELIKAGKIQAGHDVGSGGLITTLLELCFADRNLGAKLDLTALGQQDSVAKLFSENISIVFQADVSVEEILKARGVPYHKIGEVTSEPTLLINDQELSWSLDIDYLRDVWFKTSYLLDQKQSGKAKATERFENYKNHLLQYNFPTQFTGQKPVVSGVRPKAAVLREKGSNSERELANALYLAGFDVKDVHMTDLISGRETLEDSQFLGAVGGFSNSDVLGSAKGWAGAFLYNEKARLAIENFFKRKDTLSVGICNGCQLFIELGLINSGHELKPKMKLNESHKHESLFTTVTIQENNSVMLSSLAGSTLGVWVSHGEGRFEFPYEENEYQIAAKYSYHTYPANPNGSDYDAAMLCDKTGRHLVMMPHAERSSLQWQWPYYPSERKDEVSPWIEAFVNARNWLIERH